MNKLFRDSFTDSRQAPARPGRTINRTLDYCLGCGKLKEIRSRGNCHTCNEQLRREKLVAHSESSGQIARKKKQLTIANRILISLMELGVPTTVQRNIAYVLREYLPTMLSAINDLAPRGEEFTIETDHEGQDGVHESTASVISVDSNEDGQKEGVPECTYISRGVDSEHTSKETSAIKVSGLAPARGGESTFDSARADIGTEESHSADSSQYGLLNTERQIQEQHIVASAVPAERNQIQNSAYTDPIKNDDRLETESGVIDEAWAPFMNRVNWGELPVTVADERLSNFITDQKVKPTQTILLAREHEGGGSLEITEAKRIQKIADSVSVYTYDPQTGCPASPVDGGADALSFTGEGNASHDPMIFRAAEAVTTRGTRRKAAGGIHDLAIIR